MNQLAKYSDRAYALLRSVRGLISVQGSRERNGLSRPADGDGGVAAEVLFSASYCADVLCASNK